jgi:peptide-methionine (S)-S-oxide reductase
MQEQATLGGGCYWCLEAFYQRVRGVSSVVSGYSGGTVDNPTAKRVYVGDTGHAEVIQLTYDPKIQKLRQKFAQYLV